MVEEEKAGPELKLKSFLATIGRPSGPEEVGQLPHGHALWQFHLFLHKRLSSFPDLPLSHYSFFLSDYLPLPFLTLFFPKYVFLFLVLVSRRLALLSFPVFMLSLSTSLCSPNMFNLSKLNFNVVKEISNGWLLGSISSSFISSCIIEKFF